MSAPPVSLHGIEKRFGATTALAGVSLAIAAGEVHGIAGENGAGKSTLMKVLAGVYGDYDGEIWLAGKTVRFGGPADALRCGIATIHQELSLVGSLSIADNLALTEPGPMWGWMRRSRRIDRARSVLARMGLDLDPRRSVESLPLALRQLVEIARALASNAKVIIMDEPTSALSDAETERLLGEVVRLRAEGKAVAFISHRLDELERIADRITVLRDGEVAHSGEAGALDREALVKAMVGRKLAEGTTGVESSDGEPLLRLRGTVLRDALRDRPLVDGVSLTLAAGEIMGVAGLVGSGAAWLPYLSFGAPPPSEGSIELDGKRIEPGPRRCIAAGVLLMSGDRTRSLIPPLSVSDNAALSSLPRFSSAGLLDRPLLERSVERLAERLSLRTPSLQAPLWQLSGGNQQKVALMRCLLAEPRVLLLDDPTRGVDVAAKRDIHALVQQWAERGVAVMVTSSDTGELAALCTRVVVMSGGRQVAELRGETLTREAIVAAAVTGGAA